MTDKVDSWQIAEVADFIYRNGHTIVTAQFPDDLLHESASICNKIKSACEEKGHAINIYILADTTYNSLSVDEVAASHVNAHCVVHFGRASLTRLSRLPAFYVFPKKHLDCQKAARAIAATKFTAYSIEKGLQLVVFLDQVYLDSLPEFKEAFEKSLLGIGADKELFRVTFADVPTKHAEPQLLKTKTCCDSIIGSSSTSNEKIKCCQQNKVQTTELAGYSWKSPDRKSRYIWIGAAHVPALAQLQLTHNTAEWLSFDPETGHVEDGLPVHVTRTLRRRFFYIEKAREANIVGILVGTLGAAGYGNAVQRLRRAAQAAGKKTYTVLVGKPSPAKLANFPEIEVFVMVADPQGQILECKDYLAPIITPYEAMIAFNSDAQWLEEYYRLDFDDLASAGCEGSRIKLGNGGSMPSESALATQAQQSLVVSSVPSGGSHLAEVRSAADYLVHRRTWRGVDAPLVGSEAKGPASAVKGSSGRAAGYSHEKLADNDGEP